MPESHWHIMGAGAIGSLFAAALSEQHKHLTLVVKGDSNPGPLTIERETYSDQVTLPYVNANNCGPVTHLLVTTKAYDALDAVNTVRAHLAPGAVVVLMCNGMGIAEAIEARQPEIGVYRATTTAGAHRLSGGRIKHVATGQTRIGRQGQDTAPDWFKPWSACVENCLWDANIDVALWQKLAVNAVINPLTALHRCHNGALASEPSLLKQVKLLCQEVAQVIAAAGYIETADNLEGTVLEVIKSTSANRSSMLQDVEAGRRTEIDYITGYLLNHASNKGVATPLNLELYEQVRNIGR